MSDSDGGLRARLASLFVEELDDDLRVLVDGVAALQHRQPGPQDLTTVHAMFRAAHGLKGAAHSAGITDAVAPCHRLEEVFASVRSGSRAVDDELLAAVADDIDVLHAVRRGLVKQGGTAPAGDTATDVPLAAAGPEPTAPVGRARVAVARLDELVDQAAMLATVAQRVGRLAGRLESASEIELAQVAVEAAAAGRELQRAVTLVGETAQQLRLQSFRDVVTGLDQTVREAARATGRSVRLVVAGGDVELDREVGDGLREPLVHLVRNAVDHGVEDRAARTAAGKPETALVEVAAERDGRQIRIVVSDDGSGFDAVALRAAAEARGVVADNDVGVGVAFVPGVTTAAGVTDVSGRGIGLDAVRARIESMSGSVRVDSRPGGGAAIELRVPATLAVMRVVVVDLGGGQTVSLPVANIARAHRATDAVERVEGRLQVVLPERTAPAAWLAHALGVRDHVGPASAPTALEIVGEDGVLLVERAQDDLDVVLRALPPRAAGSPAVLGTALLPDGEPVVVINPSTALRAGLAMAPSSPVPTAASARQATVLLAEDSLTTRAMERSILESAGYAVVPASDGAEAWELLHQAPVDLVVSDIDMPRMSGIDLCRAMRASERFARIPVVLVTSLASDDDRRRGLDAGADVYLVKSAFEQASLLDAVGRLL